MATLKYGSLELVPSPELGLTLQSKFFGADIRFSTSKTYSLRGTLFAQTQTSGISGIFTRQEQIVTGFQLDYQPLIINDIIIGYPQVKSISFDNGSWVQKDGYTIELEILDSGYPFQITGSDYGFTSVSGLFNNIESLTEELTYNSDFRTFNYSHNVDIQYRTGVNTNPLLNAKLIASGLINNKSAFPFVVSGGISGNKTYEEREDVFGGNYGVTENFQGTTGNLPFDHLYSIRLQLDDNGIITVAQEGIVKGYNPNKYTSAKNGYNTIKSDIFVNCSGFYNRYGNGVLNNTYLTDSRIDDINNGEVQYSRSFNDESGVSNTRWRYTTQITLDGTIVNGSEQGSVNGLGHISSRFSQASGFYFGTVQTGIKQRVIDQISGLGLTGNFVNNSKEQSFNRFDGVIDYGYGFTNNPGAGVGSGILQVDVVINDNLPVGNRVVFQVIGISEVVQSLNSSTQGSRTIEVNSQAFRQTPQQTILDFTKNKINEYRPISSSYIDPFLNSMNLDYNPIQNNMRAQATYLFGGYHSETGLFI